jgi:hypothetical protein
MPRAIQGGYFPARRCDTLGDRQSTRSANRALHVSVTHSQHNLRRLPKDERHRQRERSMCPVILGTLKAIKALSCEVCRCGFRVPGVTLASVRMPAASGPIVSVAFCGWGGGGQISGAMKRRTGGLIHAHKMGIKYKKPPGPTLTNGHRLVHAGIPGRLIGAVDQRPRPPAAPPLSAGALDCWRSASARPHR